MNHCKECDQVLWSVESRETGLCVECREGEYAGPVDLEDALELEAIKSAKANVAHPTEAAPAAVQAETATAAGRNMFYEGRFQGESERQQTARLRWANDMRAAFERHTGNGWFDKDWHAETGIWTAAWNACLAASNGAAVQGEALTYVRARAALTRAMSFEVCEPTDPNAVPVYLRAPAADPVRAEAAELLRIAQTHIGPRRPNPNRNPEDARMWDRINAVRAALSTTKD